MRTLSFLFNQKPVPMIDMCMHERETLYKNKNHKPILPFNRIFIISLSP